MSSRLTEDTAGDDAGVRVGPIRAPGETVRVADGDMTHVNTVELGEVSVTRVVEWVGPVLTARQVIPDVDPQRWVEQRADLAPDFWDPRTDAYRCAMQSWVLRSGGATIVVDTGVGNDRDRPQIPQFDHARHPFLNRLAAAGIRPEDVDVVINTHIHYDHVGWNTRLVDDAWVPTFPNAKYLIPRIDRDYFDPANDDRRPPAHTEADQLRRRGGHIVFADSIAPVLDQAPVTLWRERLDIDENLTLEPAPGHTPGSSVLRLRSKSERALFVGDILHSPVQVPEPDANSCFCEDPSQARATRRRILTEAADTGALMFPAHLAGHGAVTIRRRGDAFATDRWAGFDRI